MGEPVEQSRILGIRESLDKREIQYIVFDLDGTLIDTRRYYDDRIISTISSCAHVLQIPNPDQFTQQTFDHVGQIHRQVGTPMLVQELTYLALQKTMEEERREISKEKMEFLNAYTLACFSDFYFHSPEPFPEALEVLHTVVQVRKPFFVYTHTQEPAAGIKIRHFIRRYQQAYGTRLNLPYYATDISQLKDSSGWQTASDNLFFYLEHALIIGDNPISDINASRDAGCRNHILINPRIETPFVSEDGILVVQHIGQIFDNI